MLLLFREEKSACARESEKDGIVNSTIQLLSMRAHSQSEHKGKTRPGGWICYHDQLVLSTGCVKTARGTLSRVL